VRAPGYLLSGRNVVIEAGSRTTDTRRPRKTSGEPAAGARS